VITLLWTVQDRNVSYRCKATAEGFERRMPATPYYDWLVYFPEKVNLHKKRNIVAYREHWTNPCNAQYSGQRHALSALYSRELTPGTHWIRGWVGLRAGLDTEVRGKALCLCRGSNPGRPVFNEILYWLSYPNSYGSSNSTVSLYQLLRTTVMQYHEVR
jgi:hypothetical protein